MLHTSENFPVFYHSTSFILSACCSCMGKGSYRNTKHKYVISGLGADVWFSLWFLNVCFVFYEVKMTMPDPLVGRTRLSHRIQYFFIWNLVAAHVMFLNSEWGYRGFLWTKGTPKYISQQQGNKPNFGKSEWGNLEKLLSVSKHWPYAFVIVRRQSKCFDALLIFKRMLMSENWFKQDVRILQFMLRIDGMFCVRRYQQFCVLVMNGNADNQNLLIAVTHCVEKTDFDQVGSLVLFNWNMRKVRLALATPLRKQLSHVIAEPPRGPRGCFNCLS